MRHPVARLIGVVALGIVLVAVVAARAYAAPELGLDHEVRSLGDDLLVSGTGWASGDVVNVELCGNDALNGSADCDVVNGRTAVVRHDGTFGLFIRVGRPPAFCPCVVRVRGTRTRDEAVTPIAVSGVVDVQRAVRDPSLPGITLPIAIRESEVIGDGPVKAWFGASPMRTLLLTIENVGEAAVSSPSLSLAVGKGSDPDGIVDPFQLDALEPGETKTYRIPVELPSMAWGGYTVAGRISDVGASVRFSVETSSYPWGLIALGVVLVAQVPLVMMRNGVRRRLGDRDQDVVVDAAPAAPGAAHPCEIDLTERGVDASGPEIALDRPADDADAGDEQAANQR